MPDIPGPRPNPSFSPREAGPADPGLEHLSEATQQAAENLRGAAEDIRDFFASAKGAASASFAQQAWERLQQGKQLLFAERPGSVEAAIQVAHGKGAIGSAEDVLRTMQAYQAGPQATPARVTPAVPEPPPPAPTPLVAPPLPATPTPAPPGLEPPPVPASALPTLPNVPPPTPEMVARWQEHANATRQVMHLPGYGKLTPQTPPVPEPVTPPPQEPPVPPALTRQEEARTYQEYHGLRNRADLNQRPLKEAEQARLEELETRLGLARPTLSTSTPTPPAPIPTPAPTPPEPGPTPPPPEPSSPDLVPPGYDPADIERRNQARRQALLAQFEEARRARQAVQESEPQEQEQAQQEEARRRYETQHRAAQATYHQLTSPLARAAYEDRRRTEMGEEAEQHQQAGRQAAIEGRVIGGPESQALDRARVEAQEQARTNELRQQAQAEQARAAYLATPEGQQQTRQQQDAQRQQQEALEVQRRRENVEQYGRLGAALREARDRLGDFGEALAPVVKSTKGLLGTMFAFGAQASPQAASTLSGSWQLLQATVGREFLPAMDEASSALQSARNWYRENLGEGLKHPGERHGGTFFDLGQFRLYRDWALGFGTKDDTQPERSRADIMRSWEGMPPGGYALGGEQYYERIQMAGMNVDPLRAETMREQMSNMVGVLERIDDRIASMGQRFVPAWR